MRKIFLIFLAALTATTAATLAYAQTETMTLQTYYPAPMGQYNQLRLAPRGAPLPNCAVAADEGSLYYSSADSELKICTDKTGALSWQAIGGGSVWTRNTTVVPQTIYPTDLTSIPNVGIDLNNPTERLQIDNGAMSILVRNTLVKNYALTVTNQYAGAGAFPVQAATFNADGAGGANTVHYGVNASASGALGTNAGVYATASGITGTKYGVYSDINVSDAQSKYGVYGRARGAGGTKYGVYGRAEGNDGSDKYGLFGWAIGNTVNSNKYGVNARAEGNDALAKYGVFAVGTGAGIKYGVYAGATGVGTNYGFQGSAAGGTINNYGVMASGQGVAGSTNYGLWAQATTVGTTNNYGVYAAASGATTANYAGYFVGDVTVQNPTTPGRINILPTAAGGNAEVFLGETTNTGNFFRYDGATDLIGLYGNNAGVTSGPYITVGRDTAVAPWWAIITMKRPVYFSGALANLVMDGVSANIRVNGGAIYLGNAAGTDYGSAVTITAKGAGITCLARCAQIDRAGCSLCKDMSGPPYTVYGDCSGAPCIAVPAHCFCYTP